MSAQKFRAMYLRHWNLARDCDNLGDMDEAKVHYDKAEMYYELAGNPFPTYPDGSEPDRDTLDAIDEWRAKHLRFIPGDEAYTQYVETLEQRGGDHV
jgi:hypothetical protein